MINFLFNELSLPLFYLSSSSKTLFNMTLSDDLIIDGMMYILGAGLAYLAFGASQLFRKQYIEEMAYSPARLTNKFVEYLTLLCSGVLLFAISHYHGIFYYTADLILGVLLVRQFMRSDQLQRSEYLRHYNNSKHKLINRIIVNLGYFSNQNDN